MVIFATSAFAALTRGWYIPNFLDIEVLCPNYALPTSEYFCKLQGKRRGRDCEVFPEDMHCDSWKCVDKPIIYEKPVIYLYPRHKQDIQVRLDYKGEIFADYPEYNEEIKGWKVLAYPDGKLINYADGNE